MTEREGDVTLYLKHDFSSPPEMPLPEALESESSGEKNSAGFLCAIK